MDLDVTHGRAGVIRAVVRACSTQKQLADADARTDRSDLPRALSKRELRRERLERDAVEVTAADRCFDLAARGAAAAANGCCGSHGAVQRDVPLQGLGEILDGPVLGAQCQIDAVLGGEVPGLEPAVEPELAAVLAQHERVAAHLVGTGAAHPLGAPPTHTHEAEISSGERTIKHRRGERPAATTLERSSARKTEDARLGVAERAPQSHTYVVGPGQVAAVAFQRQVHTVALVDSASHMQAHVRALEGRLTYFLVSVRRLPLKPAVHGGPCIAAIRKVEGNAPRQGTRSAAWPGQLGNASGRRGQAYRTQVEDRSDCALRVDAFVRRAQARRRGPWRVCEIDVRLPVEGPHGQPTQGDASCVPAQLAGVFGHCDAVEHPVRPGQSAAQNELRPADREATFVVAVAANTQAGAPQVCVELLEIDGTTQGALTD